MIHVNNKEITQIFYRTKVITAVYHGVTLVWNKIASYWRGELTWNGNDTWKQ